MRRRSRRPNVHDLPEPHRVVLELLIDLDQGEGVSWERLRDAAADKGICEDELHLIMHGRPRA